MTVPGWEAQHRELGFKGEIMKASEIRDQLLRIEGFADGVKQGAQIFAKWVAETLEQEEKKKQEENQSHT